MESFVIRLNFAMALGGIWTAILSLHGLPGVV